jgi:plasmid stability protein
MLHTHALPAYNAYMQYTIRDIPDDVNKALRAKAQAEGKSINQTVVDVLRQGLCLENPLQKKRDLSDIAGTWIEDREFNKAMEDFERIDPEEWK